MFIQSASQEPLQRPADLLSFCLDLGIINRDQPKDLMLHLGSYGISESAM